MKFNLNIDNINYIKITYKDNDGFSHCTKAAIKSLDEREIYACAKFEDGLYIHTPQEVELSIASENGLYKANAQLKYVKKDGSFVFFTLQTPEDMEYQQNREYFRVKLSENALISYEENEGTRYIACETYDISANGVRLVLDNKIKFPEEVSITLRFPAKSIKTDAKFIRIDDEDNILKASFSFNDLEESDLDYISQICLKKQLEQRRKNLM